MPLAPGTRFRMKPMQAGGFERLAFAPGSNRVIEAKNMTTGAVHTPAEFAADRAVVPRVRLGGVARLGGIANLLRGG